MSIKPITIGNKDIGKGKTFIVAEAGVNHNGDIDLAAKMIDVAKECQVDAIKFQTYKTEKVISARSPLAEYQKKNVPNVKDQLDLVKKFELSFDNFSYLKEYAENRNLIFLSSPFDDESVAFLDKIGVSAFKIASGEITNVFLLDQIASLSKPVILSTGMASLGDIEFALKRFYAKNNREIILLHCITNYPSKIEEANVKAIQTLRAAFQHLVGLSDHTLGFIVPLLAISMGAVLVEKHFTLDKSMEGPDHKASLNPTELKELVESVRLAEKALGNGIKIPTESEIEIGKITKKSLIANKLIKKGEAFSLSNLTVKRPGTGIDPRSFELIIGKIAKIDIPEDTILSWDMINW